MSTDTKSDIIEEYIENAEGKSVTRERLTGEEKYYPNVIECLVDEQPHHILLLRSSWGASAVEIEKEGSERAMGGDTVIAITDIGIHFVGSADHYMPYQSIYSVSYSTSLNQVLPIRFDTKSGTYSCYRAKRSDKDNFKEGLRYVKKKLR